MKVEAEGTGLKYKWQAQKPGESSWSDFNDTTAPHQNNEQYI